MSMGTNNVGWGQPGDHYYGGACRRCGGVSRTDIKGDCSTTFEGLLQHLMDTHEAPGMGMLYASDLFALLQLLGRERKAMADRIADQDERIRSLTHTINGMADALAETRLLLGITHEPVAKGDGGEYHGTPG